MSPAEVGARARDEFLQQAWRYRQVRPGTTPQGSAPGGGELAFSSPLPATAAAGVPAAARDRLIAAADRLMAGEWVVLGVGRTDLRAPDWFIDPLSGRRAPQDSYAFAINHRSEDVVGNIKQVWELSRHHHITTLAAAWFLTRDERYADRAERHLRSWWDANPFLSGVHWTSGIELGIRLISWTWTRRLLDDWPGVGDLFERNDQARRQLYWHQRYLATFRSTGSSANNHVIAEAAGQLVASCGLPWFKESRSWRRAAATLLELELDRNTFTSGVNRELASAYHGFVAELALVAAVEADVSGDPLGDETWSLLVRMFDAAASLVDSRVRPPRQGDGDDGRALVVDADADDGSWSSLLAVGAAVLGALPWWPSTSPDVRSTVIAAMHHRPRELPNRPDRRLSYFADAGIALLRTPVAARPEIWCRCDSGPHGFLSIAAHAHADALSVEVRCGGVDVLADPGTYCYHGEPEWRRYFRSTLGHNTVEIAGCDQSQSGGPFLWVEHAATRTVALSNENGDEITRWSGEHDGYDRLVPPVTHRRTVVLDKSDQLLTITDELVGKGTHPLRLSFHLGPTIGVTLDQSAALLRWTGPEGDAMSAALSLPGQLRWQVFDGSSEPVLGWYSPSFGVKQPASSLVGDGHSGREALITTLRFGRI